MTQQTKQLILNLIQFNIQRNQELDLQVLANSIATLANAYKTISDAEVDQIRLQHETQLTKAKLQLEAQQAQLNATKVYGDLSIKEMQVQQANNQRTSDIR